MAAAEAGAADAANLVAAANFVAVATAETTDALVIVNNAMDASKKALADAVAAMAAGHPVAAIAAAAMASAASAVATATTANSKTRVVTAINHFGAAGE